MDSIITLLDSFVPRLTPALQIAVRVGGQLVLSHAAGWLDPETRERPTDTDTLFDLASLTKLFTTAAFMTLVEQGRSALDQPVREVLPEFSGPRPIQGEERSTVDAGRVTFRHLLAHNAGLPASLIVDTTPGTAVTAADLTRSLALNTPFAYPTGARVIYSDIGLILLGMAVEALSGMSLQMAVRERVTAPLGLRRTRFLPLPPDVVPWYALEAADPDPNIAPTEYDAWRGRRIQGEVHDENAWRLGGVAGHAGLFSTAEEIAAFGQVFLDGGLSLFNPAAAASLIAEMVREQSAEGLTRRGIGFQLWSPDPAASYFPFSPRTFGHTGFTGTSLWIDPERSLVVALLTNEVYHGRVDRHIAALRLSIHQAIVDVVGYNGGVQ